MKPTPKRHKLVQEGYRFIARQEDGDLRKLTLAEAIRQTEDLLRWADQWKR